MQVALQEYPSLRPAWPVGSREFSGEEIYDGDFSESGAVVVLASATRLKVLGGVPVDTTVDPASEDKTPKIIQTIQNPALGGKAACSFRAARFGRGDASRNKLYTIVNASSGGKGKGKGAARKRYLWSKVDTLGSQCTKLGHLPTFQLCHFLECGELGIAGDQTRLRQARHCVRHQVGDECQGFLRFLLD